MIQQHKIKYVFLWTYYIDLWSLEWGTCISRVYWCKLVTFHIPTLDIFLFNYKCQKQWTTCACYEPNLNQVTQRSDWSWQLRLKFKLLTAHKLWSSHGLAMPLSHKDFFSEKRKFTPSFRLIVEFDWHYLGLCSLKIPPRLRQRAHCRISVREIVINTTKGFQNPQSYCCYWLVHDSAMTYFRIIWLSIDKIHFLMWLWEQCLVLMVFFRWHQWLSEPLDFIDSF